MSRSPNTSRPPLLQSTNAMKDDDEASLSHSFSQLSISSQRGSRSPTVSSKPSTPLRPPSRHASPSPARPPSRSPSRNLESRAGTPTLIRKASMNSLHSANGGGRSLSRRSSYSQLVSPSSRAINGAVHYEPEKPPQTAHSIAKAYFQAELEAHHGPVSTLKTETVVIVNDSVYGHRFSRPRTSKGALSTIVERPERIKAGLLGVSLAYVRLGERHSDGAFPVQSKRNMQTLPSIPFRIHKTSRRVSLSSPAVTNVHGTKWMEDLKLMCESAESILANGGKELQRPSSKGSDQGSAEKLHEGDLYLCSESLEAMEGALGAVCDAVDTVFSMGPRRAFVAVRPPGHHCSASQPSGFCWVNNVHVGIMHGVLNHGLTHAAIIDFDLHHGDGSQSIAWAHNSRAKAASKSHAAWKKSSIGYFSLHDINSYPCEMGDDEKVRNASICIDNAHGQTVWNVHLQPWETEQEFWEIYQTKYVVLLDKTRKYLKDQAARLKAAKQEPRAVIFLSAGFDASEWEGAGMQRHKVNVPTEFYARLTQDVIQIAAEEGLYVDGRIVSVLEGGYSDRALYSGILSHLSGLVGNQTCENAFQEFGGLGSEMSSKLATVQDDVELSTTNTLASVYPYDPLWWSGSELDKLDEVMAQIPEPPPKMLRISSSPAPAYTSPTQSSQAKVVDSLKARRSFSALSSASSRLAYRSPSPTPPEVTWMIAAQELSKLLIPSDRQTGSCTHEDLNAEATRIRRDRQSAINGLDSTPTPEHDRPSSKMSLRERKPRTIDPIREESSVALTRNRRRTVLPPATTTEIAGLQMGSPVTPVADRRNQAPISRGTASQPSSGLPARRPARRSSASSLKPSSDGSVSTEPVVSRPATSIGSRPTSRPASALNARPTTTKIAVKKPRAPVPTRRDTLPRTPRSVTVSPPTSSGGLASTRSEPARDDMSNLTNGMKKIKINLITKSQKEAREKARLETEKVVATQPLVSSPTPETPGAPFQTPSPGNVPALTTTSESGLSTPVLEHYASTAVSPELKQATPFGSSPAVTVRPNDETNDFFVPYQPEGPAPVAIAQQEPLKWLPPAVSSPPVKSPTSKTPSPTKSPVKSNIFKYTSGIPFAPQSKLRRASERIVSPKQKS
ncbi:Histone deacetylase HOS3 [Cladobotryum mycophilum]|uniref:Histone deacetylase HOS3 n=1 Tax=Cladobotryum mycophilum TaxID=491253 RepID=A0ABR0SG62_9HYPO